MFMQGNPFSAMTSLIGYHFARDEASLVAVTERLGQTRSPFTVDELLGLLADPRFNVRFEAIISIARTRRHPCLTLIPLLDACADHLARGQMTEGVEDLSQIVAQSPNKWYSDYHRAILQDSLHHLAERETIHEEYLLLVLYTLALGRETNS